MGKCWGSTEKNRMRSSGQGAMKEWEKEQAEEEGKCVGSIKMGKCWGGALRKIG